MIELDISRTFNFVEDYGDNIRLSDETKKWCTDVLGYVPPLSIHPYYSARLEFQDDTDIILFKMVFAQYWIYPHDR